MATAFQNLDPVPFTPKPQPNIRVAFSATPAVAAVRAKGAGEGASDKTLDEIAAAEWERLCADYETAYAAELLAIEASDDRLTEFYVRKGDDPEPEQPSLGPIDTSRPFQDIIEDSRTPEWKACWAAYEAKHAAWKERQEALRQSITGEAEANATATMHVTEAAFDRIRSYPVKSLAALADKAAMLQKRYDNLLEDQDAQLLIRDIRMLAGFDGVNLAGQGR